MGGSSLGQSIAAPPQAQLQGSLVQRGTALGPHYLPGGAPHNPIHMAALLTPTRWPRVTDRPMDRAGEPTGLVRRASVEEKMQSASWKVRISSTTMAWPGVVLLLSCKGREG